MAKLTPRFVLQRFSQLLQETEHFCRWRQEKVAKIVPYAPPFPFKDLQLFIRSSSIRSSRDLARSWRASRTKLQRSLVQRINCRSQVLRDRVSVTSGHLQSGVTQQ